MQLICPKCENLVEIEDGDGPEKRRPVRCGNCSESWFTGGKTDLYALSFAKPSKVDPEVARILQEEVEWEMAARKAEDDKQISAGSTIGKNQVSTDLEAEDVQGRDDYVALNWRQRSILLFICLLAGLSGLFVFAPNIVMTFPELADWVSSYVFWVNDMRQSLDENLRRVETFVIDLDIGGKFNRSTAWLTASIQYIINFFQDFSANLTTDPAS